MLAVRDDELDVGVSEVASSEVARGGDMRRKARGSHVDRSGGNRQPGSGFPGKLGCACL